MNFGDSGDFEDRIVELLNELPESAGRIMDELEEKLLQTEEETLIGTLEILGDAMKKGRLSDGDNNLSETISWLLRELKGKEGDHCSLDYLKKLICKL